jgi:hypothetical protein
MRYKSKPLTIDAVQYDGGNLNKILEIIPRNAGVKIGQVYREPTLTFDAPGRPTRLIHVGDWVSWDGGEATIHSDQSFSRFWEEIK